MAITPINSAETVPVSSLAGRNLFTQSTPAGRERRLDVSAAVSSNPPGSAALTGPVQTLREPVSTLVGALIQDNIRQGTTFGRSGNPAGQSPAVTVAAPDFPRLTTTFPPASARTAADTVQVTPAAPAAGGVVQPLTAAGVPQTAPSAPAAVEQAAPVQVAPAAQAGVPAVESPAAAGIGPATVAAPAAIEPAVTVRITPAVPGTGAATRPLAAPGPPQATLAAPAAGALARPADQAADAIVDNALFISDILGRVGFIPADLVEEPFFVTPSPLLTALQENQDLTPLQRNALLVNRALDGLGFIPAEPRDPLLIDVIPPGLAAREPTADPGLIQLTGIFLNLTLEDLGVEPRVGPELQPLTAAAETVTAADGTVLAGVAAEAAPADRLVPAATGEEVPVTPLPVAAPAAAAAAAAPPLAPAAATTPELIFPAEARFLTPELTPATLPVTMFPDRTPYVIVVYRLDNPALPAAGPEPLDRQVPQPTPLPAIHPVADARLRQLQQHFGEGRGPEATERRPALSPAIRTEQAIRTALGRLNADLAAQELPLHLVLARNDQGFALDVYDCSFNELCRLTYDIPISMDDVTGLLARLEQETGLIVDTAS